MGLIHKRSNIAVRFSVAYQRSVSHEILSVSHLMSSVLTYLLFFLGNYHVIIYSLLKENIFNKVLLCQYLPFSINIRQICKTYHCNILKRHCYTIYRYTSTSTQLLVYEDISYSTFCWLMKVRFPVMQRLSCSICWLIVIHASTMQYA